MQNQKITFERINNAIRYRIKKYYYYYYEKKLEFYSNNKYSYGLNKRQRANSYIISLTSYYKRFNVLHLTLESLLNQAYKPDKIILWLSQEDLEKKALPRKIIKLKSRGIEIRIVNENIRSYKKLLYSLDEYPESHIITSDDDVLYPYTFLKKLVNTSDKYPECIVAYTCRLMKLKDKGRFELYSKWGKYVSWNKPSFKLLPIGASGILYPPNSLSQEVFNKNIFLKLAPTADDLWFKAMALLNNTKTVLVDYNSITFLNAKGSQEDSLTQQNVLQNKNDEQLKSIFDHYSLYESLNK